MTLDSRLDSSDTFCLREKVVRLQEEIAHHQESHAVANKLLMEERNKISSMEATIKFEVAGKYNAYKDLKVASTLISQVETMIADTNRLYVMFDKRIKKLEMEEKFVASMKKFRKIISDLKREHTNYRIEKKNLDKVFEIK
jgi:hypothetical protein